MENQINLKSKYWWIFLLLGLFAVGLGIALLCSPLAASAIATYLFAAYFLVTGIVDVINVISNRKNILAWGWPLLGAILIIIFGIVLLCVPLFSAGIISILFAFAIICMGIRFATSVVYIEGTGKKILLIILGFLIVVAGLVCLFNPFGSFLTIGMLEAISMIMFGVASIVFSIQLSKLRSLEKNK